MHANQCIQAGERGFPGVKAVSCVHTHEKLLGNTVKGERFIWDLSESTVALCVEGGAPLGREGCGSE